MILETPFVAALNHLLRAEPWARERLAPFAGETVALHGPALPTLRFTVAVDGTLEPAAPGAALALELRFRPDALAFVARGGEHALRAVDVNGNAAFASELMFLARHLRRDVEEEASRWIGDIAAHRLVGLGRELGAWHVDAARRLGEGMVEYALEEKRLLVKRGDLAALAEAQARLRDGIERLEKRIQRLAEG